MKRFFIDAAGNYIFWVTLVVTLNVLWAGWDFWTVYKYMIISIPTALLGGPAFIWFLKNWWYPLWREDA